MTAGNDGFGVFAKEENLTLAVTFLVSLLINTTSHYGWVDYRWYGV